MNFIIRASFRFRVPSLGLLTAHGALNFFREPEKKAPMQTPLVGRFFSGSAIACRGEAASSRAWVT
jgi:hypothetical protein